jgi:hypothetical protein
MKKPAVMRASGHFWTMLDKKMAPKSGIEPETYRLGGGRSIH